MDEIFLSERTKFALSQHRVSVEDSALRQFVQRVVKGFNLWDRQTLINKYEADFYHGSPAKSTLAFARTDRGWRTSAQ